jgi:predicted RNase H-like nuclease (RuvC/YqgF family)
MMTAPLELEQRLHKLQQMAVNFRSRISLFRHDIHMAAKAKRKLAETEAEIITVKNQLHHSVYTPSTDTQILRSSIEGMKQELAKRMEAIQWKLLEVERNNHLCKEKSITLTGLVVAVAKASNLMRCIADMEARYGQSNATTTDLK